MSDESENEHASQQNDPERNAQNEWGHPERNAQSSHCHPEQSRRAQRGGAVEGSTVSTNLNPITQLRRFTPARIALSRSGDSLPTGDLLEFSLDHALARDAVHAPLDTAAITEQLVSVSFESIRVHSAAIDRAIYLRRPDLGRQLDTESRNRLSALKLAPEPQLLFIIADGLSAIAPQRYAVEVIREIHQRLHDWKIGPVVIAEQARVALGDEIGELFHAEITVMLIGERPGLSAPDSLGIYLTYDPKTGRSDAERNCISNVRNEGMSVVQAADTLCYLLTNSRRLKFSGVELKDESHLPAVTLPAKTGTAKLLPRDLGKLI